MATDSDSKETDDHMDTDVDNHGDADVDDYVDTAVDDSEVLADPEQEFLDAIRAAESLSDLQRVVGSDSEDRAYLRAKAQWKTLRERELAVEEFQQADGLAGTCVVVDDQEIYVHGITHADTDEEREFLRERVLAYVDAGETVYCEQGIRPMYFQDIEAVCEIDDYQWAMHRCRERDIDSHIKEHLECGVDDNGSLAGMLDEVASRFRGATFSLIKSGSDVYGDRFASALGDVASDFLRTHGDLATGDDFASFQKSSRAARNPEELASLQWYYSTVFLPQPLEREWLKKHDPELELFTHARNERIAAYVLYYASTDVPVHIITGAAHQPGIVYYLQAYGDDEWTFEPFETF